MKKPKKQVKQPIFTAVDLEVAKAAAAFAKAEEAVKATLNNIFVKCGCGNYTSLKKLGISNSLERYIYIDDNEINERCDHLSGYTIHNYRKTCSSCKEKAEFDTKVRESMERIKDTNECQPGVYVRKSNILKETFWSRYKDVVIFGIGISIVALIVAIIAWR